MNPLLQIKTALLIIQFSLALLWIYQGLIPKLCFHAADELRIWQLQGLSSPLIQALINVSGGAEIIFGVLFCLFRQEKILHLLNILALLSLSVLIVLIVALDPTYFTQAFNPFVMNTAMIALSIVALQLLNIQKSLR